MNEDGEITATDRAASTTPNEVLALKREYLVPCVYHFYRRPPVIVAARDCELFDQDGRRYLDFYSGVTVVNAGHCNPTINAAIAEQMGRLDHTTTIYLTEPIVRLAERLAEITPGPLKRSFFCASGSEANEGAMLLASLHTGRSGIVALTHGLHGRTKWAMGATCLPMWRTDPSPPPGIHFAPHPHCPGCPLGLEYSTCGLACAEALEKCIVQAGPDTIAALIAEPIQGNGGIVIPPDDYWPAVREICDRHGILLIFDEIQTGMNRTGDWWSCGRWDVRPDILTTAKALGNGYPIAAYVTTDEIASAYTRPGASTFGGNPVGAVAALATIEFHGRNDLAARSTQQGRYLLGLLEGLAEHHPCLQHPRGAGLMIGVDLVDGCQEQDPDRLDAVLEHLKDRGFLCGKTGNGRNVLTLMPPLTIDPRQIDAMADALDGTLKATEAG